MKEFAIVYRFSFYTSVLITFVFGGVLQYLFAVPNTVLTYGLVTLFLANYLLYVIIKGKIVLNKIVLWFLLYVGIILLSALINKSQLIPTIIYFIFPVLPLSVFLFLFINYKEGFIRERFLISFFLKIALFQLPLILIQRNFYEFLIQFNFSGQIIHSYDFMFGSFFIKSDHSLAIFIIFLVVSIIINKSGIRDSLKFPWITIIYLSITIFLAESNISKFFLSLILVLAVFYPVYLKKRKTIAFKLTMVLLMLGLFFTVNTLKDEKFIKDKFGGAIERQLSLEIAERQYELKAAKRSQILIMIFNKISPKYIGDGPYSYFNILTGNFNYTKHFTQVIWTYFDLGIIGIVILLFYLYSILDYLNIKRGLIKFLFFGILFIYSFYTTIFSDVAILLSLIAIFNKKQ